MPSEGFGTIEEYRGFIHCHRREGDHLYVDLENVVGKE